jgi:hypothetical protein
MDTAFRQGLKEIDHVEGETPAIEYRWAENQVDRFTMASEVSRTSSADLLT